MPTAGGPYVFARRAFGSFAGKLIGWTDWLSGTIVIAFVSVVFAEYLQRLGILPHAPRGILSLGLIVGCTVLNCSGTRVSGASQTILSALEGAGLVALILLLFIGSSAPEAAPVPLSNSATGWGLAAAMRAIYNTYAGWITGVYFSEELVSPERTISRSTFGGIFLVTTLYVLTNAAILHVLSPAQIAGSKLAASDVSASVLHDASRYARRESFSVDAQAAQRFLKGRFPRDRLLCC